MRLKTIAPAVLSIGVLIVLVVAALNMSKKPDILPDGDGSSNIRGTLVVHTAAGIRGPMEELANAYERAYGIRVELHFGGSGELLGKLKIDPTGDAFVSANIKQLNIAQEEGLVREILTLGSQKPVIAVAPGNPKGITGLDDLLRDDVKFALTNPESAAAGKLTQRVLTEAGQWEAISEASTVMKPTVNAVGNDIKIGSVDAGIVWDSTVALINGRQDLGYEAISMKEFADTESPVSIGILDVSTQPTLALHFSRFISSPERGAPIFRKHGFESEGGDRWTSQPEIVFYSGSVNRPAIEAAIQAFSDREGVSVATTYNGCGILCADMLDLAEKSKTNPNVRVPDGYYACDVCFIEPVKHLFPEAIVMTETDIVIAVPKGNPKNVQGLVDLAQEGFRLGISNAEQATLGFMTKRLLNNTGLLESVRPNVKVENPQADFLINHLHTGSLDAAIVYAVNVGEHIKHFDLIPIDNPGALAMQPFATSSSSPYPTYHGSSFGHPA